MLKFNSSSRLELKDTLYSYRFESVLCYPVYRTVMVYLPALGILPRISQIKPFEICCLKLFINVRLIQDYTFLLTSSRNCEIIVRC